MKDQPCNSIRLSPELQAYKEKLRTYFEQSDCYEDFSELIERELAKFGIVHWAYTELDLPDRLTAEEFLGSIDREFAAAYLDDSLYTYDLVLQHIRSSDKPVFQSDIEEQINNLSFSSEFLSGFNRIVKKRIEFGYGDSCSIPATSCIDGCRFVLCLNLKSTKSSDFKPRVSKCMPYLKVLAMTVHTTGIHKFPKIFLSPVKKYKAVAYSKPLELLRTIFKKDASIKQAAAHLGISVNTADNHIKKLKKDFEVKTIHGAYIFAKTRGLIK